MAKHRTYSIEFKRQVAQEFLSGETLHGLAKRHDVCRNLIRVWVQKYEAGGFDEDAAAADLLQQYEARIAALERLVGKQALELEFLKGAAKSAPRPRNATMSVVVGRPASALPKGGRLLGIGRSTFDDDPPAALDASAIVEAIPGICEEFEFYGWRRVLAELRHRGLIADHKKVRRLMREHDLQPRRPRYVATTDSDHDQPIYPNRAKDLAIDGPDQLWVADITYVAIREGFAYVAVILDAWSRRAIGYAISRSIDMRLTLAALNTAVERRKPPPGCIHHSDRGSQ